MKKILAAMTAALMMVALVGPASAASAKWTIWQYSGESGPSPIGAANPHGGTIATMAFDDQNDQSLLTSTANGYTKNGSLLGKAVTATISITGPAANYLFTGFDKGCSTPPTVRFYFDTKIKLGDETSFQSGLYVDQMWWSTVSISLADVWAAGPKGVTLSVTFAPANWSNLVGTNGSTDPNFTTAASNVNKIGFSFGSGCSFAFGDGSLPGGALFNLLKFSTYTP
jgi:hypothetical protein